MTVRRYGAWSASADVKAQAVKQSQSAGNELRHAMRIADELNRANGKERIAAVINHPNYEPAPENDYYKGLLNWLNSNPNAYMSPRVRAILYQTEAKLRDGQKVRGKSWQPRTRPIPAALLNLPKKPPTTR